jgi:hypothetical protein
VVGTKIHFMAEQAPCGKVVAGDHYQDQDDEGLIIRHEYYECAHGTHVMIMSGRPRTG